MRVASPAGAWEECGFTVSGGSATLGGVEIRLEGGDGGISGWILLGAGSKEIDGLPTEIGQEGREVPAEHPNTATGVDHPNSAAAVDHIVVFTPDLKRTVAAMEGAGFVLRRVREATEPGPDVRQAFFRPGATIVEVVENPHGSDGPAAFWGLTMTVADIGLAAELFGEKLGAVRDAVQPGRRIATVRREAGLGIPVALITPHPGSP